MGGPSDVVWAAVTSPAALALPGLPGWCGSAPLFLLASGRAFPPLAAKLLPPSPLPVSWFEPLKTLATGANLEASFIDYLPVYAADPKGSRHLRATASSWSGGKKRGSTAAAHVLPLSPLREKTFGHTARRRREMGSGGRNHKWQLSYRAEGRRIGALG